MAKRTPEQVRDPIAAWDVRDMDAQIDAEIKAQIDSEMERLLAMTPEEREADLRAAKALEADEKAKRGELPAPAKGSRALN